MKSTGRQCKSLAIWEIAECVTIEHHGSHRQMTRMAQVRQVRGLTWTDEVSQRASPGTLPPSKHMKVLRTRNCAGNASWRYDE